MILITIDYLEENTKDLRTIDRLLKGIAGLEKDGYIIERYDAFLSSGKRAQKRILSVTRTEEANDIKFEKWLKNLQDKKEQKKTLPILDE